MWIETTNLDSAGDPVTTRLKPEFLDEPVEFTENGKAQVTREVGEALIAEYDTLRESSGDGDGDGDSAATAAEDAAPEDESSVEASGGTEAASDAERDEEDPDPADGSE